VGSDELRDEGDGVVRFGFVLSSVVLIKLAIRPAHKECQFSAIHVLMRKSNVFMGFCFVAGLWDRAGGVPKAGQTGTV
jgi:hypothetical protein